MALTQEPRRWRVTHHPRVGTVHTEPMQAILLPAERIIAEDLTQQQAEALVALIKAGDRGHD